MPEGYRSRVIMEVGKILRFGGRRLAIELFLLPESIEFCSALNCFAKSLKTAIYSGAVTRVLLFDFCAVEETMV